MDDGEADRCDGDLCDEGHLSMGLTLIPDAYTSIHDVESEEANADANHIVYVGGKSKICEPPFIPLYRCAAKQLGVSDSIFPTTIAMCIGYLIKESHDSNGVLTEINKTEDIVNVELFKNCFVDDKESKVFKIQCQVLPQNKHLEAECLRRVYFVANEYTGCPEQEHPLQDGSSQVRISKTRFRGRPQAVMLQFLKTTQIVDPNTEQEKRRRKIDEEHLLTKINELKKYLKNLRTNPPQDPPKEIDGYSASADLWKQKGPSNLAGGVRFAMLFDDEHLIELFFARNDAYPNKSVLDAQGSDSAPPTFYKSAFEKFNDEVWDPISYALDTREWSEWFGERRDLSWTVLQNMNYPKLSNAEAVKNKFMTMNRTLLKSARTSLPEDFTAEDGNVPKSKRSTPGSSISSKQDSFGEELMSSIQKGDQVNAVNAETLKSLSNDLKQLVYIQRTSQEQARMDRQKSQEQARMDRQKMELKEDMKQWKEDVKQCRHEESVISGQIYELLKEKIKITGDDDAARQSRALNEAMMNELQKKKSETGTRLVLAESELQNVMFKISEMNQVPYEVPYEVEIHATPKRNNTSNRSRHRTNSDSESARTSNRSRHRTNSDSDSARRVQPRFDQAIQRRFEQASLEDDNIDDECIINEDGSFGLSSVE